MSDEKRKGVGRREFVKRSLAAGAGVAVLGRGAEELEAGVPGSRRRRQGQPMIITSHTNDTGRDAMTRAWDILSAGGSALDAVEKGANVIEVDPEGHGVGYGGLPNQDGVVQLDACVMDGRTYNAGSVGALENIKTPCSVARLVMERTDHVMLVGKGALEFARSFGFEEVDLLTPAARDIWLRWRERLAEDDDWGAPDHLRGTDLAAEMQGSVEFRDGTTNVLSVDADGNVSGITTTSGLSWKVPGRVGDSPIIGAGLYVDNEVGAAGVTGRGEDVIKSCASYFVVMQMRNGRTPQQACEDAADMIVEKYRAVDIDFVPSEKFVAISKDGDYGACRLGSDRAARITVANDDGIQIYEGTNKYPR